MSFSCILNVILQCTLFYLKIATKISINASIQVQITKPKKNFIVKASNILEKNKFFTNKEKEKKSKESIRLKERIYCAPNKQYA